MGLLSPLASIALSLLLLGVLLYRRISLGVTLIATALLLGFLALNWYEIPSLVYATTNPSTMDGLLTLSITIATFGIMWLSQLYKETGEIVRLSNSVSGLIRNPKIVLSVLPALIGFLPVSGGALMSAPLVDVEGDKLRLKPGEKAFINHWFRHTVFPIYPLSQVLIITAALTRVPLLTILLLQIPIVATMVAVGFLLGFRKAKIQGLRAEVEAVNRVLKLKEFISAFSPIMVTIVVAIIMDVVNPEFSKFGLEVLIATFMGLAFMAVNSHLNIGALIKPLKSWGVYDVTLAAYGAFLLRNVMKAAGIAEIFQPLISSGHGLNVITLLTIIPMGLGFLMGTASGAIALSVSILAGALTFTSKTSALLYASAYLGYTLGPTHLCLTFTANYFKTSLKEIYRYMAPSFIATFATALIVYIIPLPI
ncbi:MAG: DUF401 family protein [Thermoproteota archaeon]